MISPLPSPVKSAIMQPSGGAPRTYERGTYPDAATGSAASMGATRTQPLLSSSSRGDSSSMRWPRVTDSSVASTAANALTITTTGTSLSGNTSCGTVVMDAPSAANNALGAACEEG